MPKTVLIIEDDQDTRSIYETALTERGFRVRTAGQGAEGVHLARTHPPDLILLDIRMPVMDGWGAIRYLKSYPETRQIPICGISAYAPDEEELERAGEAAFDCFLLKPIDPKEVVAQIEARIGRPGPDMPPAEPPRPE